MLVGHTVSVGLLRLAISGFDCFETGTGNETTSIEIVDKLVRATDYRRLVADERGKLHGRTADSEDITGMTVSIVKKGVLAISTFLLLNLFKAIQEAEQFAKDNSGFRRGGTGRGDHGGALDEDEVGRKLVRDGVRLVGPGPVCVGEIELEIRRGVAVVRFLVATFWSAAAAASHGLTVFCWAGDLGL